MKRSIIVADKASSCYFRTSVEPPHRKALIQITERCNLHCLHCFISASEYGEEMSVKTIRNIVIPRLKECRVISATLTGGEPFRHSEIVDIAALFVNAGFSVSICTNATCIKESDIQLLAKIGNIRLNASLDGFSAESHGKFRGNKECFAKAISTIQMLGRYKMLHGLLVTPNSLAQVEEYSQVCFFAADNGASYVLMNPLSSMGRGTASVHSFAADNETMRAIRGKVSELSDKIQLAFVRFPNDGKLPLSACEAGNIVYVFTKGELAICPYLVFAARTKQSVHDPRDFIVGNIFIDKDIAQKLDDYNLRKRYQLGFNSGCKACQLNPLCGKGCPAAVVASGNCIESIDVQMCPKFLV